MPLKWFGSMLRICFTKENGNKDLTNVIKDEKDSRKPERCQDAIFFNSSRSAFGNVIF